MAIRIPEPQTLIELAGVSKVFRTPAGDFTALKEVNLSFNQGEFTCIIGKSGSGKSTLINMITGIDHPTKGVVRVEGREIHHMKEGQLAAWRGRTLGIIFQFFQLLPTLSILENTMLPMDFCDVYAPSEREEKALELLKVVGLEAVASKQPAALSGGQQQIAALARALANDPPILVADEPTGNLDSRTAERILGIFEELAARGKTILIVTHDPALSQRSTRQVLISDGELIDEQIARALHYLPHPQMLRLTHLCTLRTFTPKMILATERKQDIGLCVVIEGEIEMRCEKEPGVELVVGHIRPGEVISELELQQGAQCNIILRASPTAPVSALCLSPERFHDWITQFPEALRSLQKATQERCNYLNETYTRCSEGG